MNLEELRNELELRRKEFNENQERLSQVEQARVQLSQKALLLQGAIQQLEKIIQVEQDKLTNQGSTEKPK